MIAKLEDALNIQPDGSVLDKPDANIKGQPADTEANEEALDEATDDDESSEEIETPRFEPYKDLYKRRFLWYFDHYMSTVIKYVPEHKAGSDFSKMPFEGGGNTMDGKFNYPALGKRLVRIEEVIRNETNQWAVEGMALKRRESNKASTIERQFEQVPDYLKRKECHNVSVEIENNNPYLWALTYFGKPGTNLDGGIFKIRMAISPRFPEEQPRVRCETPIYHHRVSKMGTVCYFPKTLDDLRNHVYAIVESLEEDCPPYDPRAIVHPEAAALLFGTEDEKKSYFRQLRRSAQRTTEEAE